MALANRMCLGRHSIMVVSVLMTMFLWSSEAIPQADCNNADGGGGFVITEDIARGPAVNGASDRARCVPFHRCCDNTEEQCCDNKEKKTFLGLINERLPLGNVIIDISQRSGNNLCGGKLDLCCRCYKKEDIVETTTSSTTTTTTTHETKITTEKTLAPVIRQWACGKRNVDGVRIKVTGFGEGQTQQGEFPWMVAVMAKDTTFVGGGSLVHPRAVLTAGHKVHQKAPDSLMARIGDWDISEQIESIVPENIDVQNILYHPNFNRQKHEFNVAILILKTEAKYGATVAPVCLPEPGQNFDEKNCFVIGWGKDDFGDKGNFQTIMKKVDVPIVGHSRCQTMLRATRLGSDFVLHSSFTCAGGLKEDACTGDGGSPLVCPGVTNPNELVQVGVVSWGIGCGVVGNPGVYGSVVESMDWITPTIQNELGIAIDIRLG